MFAVGATCLLLAGCGGGSGSSTARQEKESDMAILNAALGKELTLADGLAAGLPLLRGDAGSLALVEELRAQEQEHADALTKAIRGLDGETEAEPGELEDTEVKAPADFFAFAYGLGSSTVASHMSAIPKVAGGHSRVMLAAIAANEAQQLVLLRKALGAGPLELVPSPFETGATPPPGEDLPQG
jgi:hypothetical protein